MSFPLGCGGLNIVVGKVCGVRLECSHPGICPLSGSLTSDECGVCVSVSFCCITTHPKCSGLQQWFLMEHDCAGWKIWADTLVSLGLLICCTQLRISWSERSKMFPLTCHSWYWGTSVPLLVFLSPQWIRQLPAMAV